MSTKGNSTVWIGVADVVPSPGNTELGTAHGAYVGVAGVADSEEQFRDIVSSSLRSMGFDLFELDDVSQIVDQWQLDQLDGDLRERVAELTSSIPFAYGRFHSYRRDQGHS